MFTLVSDATKVAFVTFCRRASAYGIRLIDCQCYTENMARYGAHEMARSEFLAQLSRHRDEAVRRSFIVRGQGLRAWPRRHR